ncbi:MAG: hypothetical protein NZZ41_03530 [Candidatus Dojkabacteria bacterium]|nr:hypothetical protein [Candidatus Dojkabacteria bacterium]
MRRKMPFAHFLMRVIVILIVILRKLKPEIQYRYIDEENLEESLLNLGNNTYSRPLSDIGNILQEEQIKPEEEEKQKLEKEKQQKLKREEQQKLEQLKQALQQLLKQDRLIQLIIDVLIYFKYVALKHDTHDNNNYDYFINSSYQQSAYILAMQRYMIQIIRAREEIHTKNFYPKLIYLLILLLFDESSLIKRSIGQSKALQQLRDINAQQELVA